MTICEHGFAGQLLTSQTTFYKIWLIHLKLLPLSYFLEYLDLLFLFCCLKGEILLDVAQFVQFSNSSTHHGSSGQDLRWVLARTFTFCESYFVRICPLWNSLPIKLCLSKSTCLQVPAESPPF